VLRCTLCRRAKPCARAVAGAPSSPSSLAQTEVDCPRRDDRKLICSKSSNLGVLSRTAPGCFHCDAGPFVILTVYRLGPPGAQACV
jgi:hypothetical protein